MPGLSRYLQDNLFLRIADAAATVWVPPATVYYGLFTTLPSYTSEGVEITGNGYARVGRTGNLTNFSGTQGKGTTAVSSGTTGTLYNNGDVTFPVAAADWGVIVAVGLFDALTAGNLLFYGPYNPVPFFVSSGVALVLSSGQFSIALGGTP